MGHKNSPLEGVLGGGVISGLVGMSGDALNVWHGDIASDMAHTAMGAWVGVYVVLNKRPPEMK
jgi:hypothetical protein